MIAIGILCMIFGGVLCVVGNSVNNDVEARMESFFSDGVTNPGSTYVTIGILLLVVGGILLLVGAIMRANRNNSSTTDRSSGNNCQQNVQNNMSPYQNQPIYRGPAAQPPKVVCPHCGGLLPKGSKFCSFCGKKVPDYL